MSLAFAARTESASHLGVSGGMLPRKRFEINALRMLKNASQ